MGHIGALGAVTHTHGSSPFSTSICQQNLTSCRGENVWNTLLQDVVLTDSLGGLEKGVGCLINGY